MFCDFPVPAGSISVPPVEEVPPWTYSSSEDAYSPYGNSKLKDLARLYPKDHQQQQQTRQPAQDPALGGAGLPQGTSACLMVLTTLLHQLLTGRN